MNAQLVPTKAQLSAAEMSLTRVQAELDRTHINLEAAEGAILLLNLMVILRLISLEVVGMMHSSFIPSSSLDRMDSPPSSRPRVCCYQSLTDRGEEQASR